MKIKDNAFILNSRFEKSVFLTIPIKDYADQLLHKGIIVYCVLGGVNLKHKEYNNIKILEIAGYGRVHTCDSRITSRRIQYTVWAQNAFREKTPLNMYII